MYRKILQKYNIPVPRYTSYPPANRFHPEGNADMLNKALIESNTSGTELVSAYIHIPFCRSLCHYCGCNAFPMADSETVERYINAVEYEIEWVAKRLSIERKISQIHFGGGSPTSVDIRFLKRIIDKLLNIFTPSANIEIAVECHPGYMVEEQWMELINAGVNRVSIGIQDFNTQVLKTVNRKPPLLDTGYILNLLKQKDVSVNLDFVYGLPFQTVESFAQTISKAIELHPNRIVTFPYAHVPWVNPAQKILEKYGLPEPDARTEMFNTAGLLLKNAGYKQIGLDHFVLPADELAKACAEHTLRRNFQGYCTKKTTGQVYAFGVTGITQLDNAYFQNTKDISLYISRIEQGNPTPDKSCFLTDKEKYIRHIIEHLMCNYEVNWEKSVKELGVSRGYLLSLTGYNNETFAGFANDGIIEITGNGFGIKEDFRILTRVIAASLDPYIQKQTNTYSNPL